MRGEDSSDVVVLGAGLAGSCVALELAARGVDVTIVDRDTCPMNRASLRNEGKIHLGLIYANDESMATAELQLAGALQFAPALRRLLGDGFERIGISTPFTYLVAGDSVLSLDELAAHYDRLDATYQSWRTDDLDYLGTHPERLVEPAAEAALAEQFALEGALGGFHTAELAIDTLDLAHVVRHALDRHPRITFRGGFEVREVQERGASIRVSGENGTGICHIDAEQVVNATWESRMALDRQFGLDVAPGWLHRLKYRVIVRLPPELLEASSVTMVIGRYGDVVIRPSGTAYLSWYPVGLRGWSHDLEAPQAWNEPCCGMPDALAAAELAESTMTAIGSWFPGIERSTVEYVDAGVIVAYGASDVDDRDSGLHGRTQVGVRSRDGFHSLDPGKLTTAPLFAAQAAERVLEHA